ncbi:hypothetical protein [Nesterenkonia sp. AN1]|uniref:hypothetical protein n=1 Tax=Nesterenkonia sp. AN1 TaxID=652017 RepID=UPI001267DEF9|nr:hypothetical protein [Nesterenkonia sp. AN1]
MDVLSAVAGSIAALLAVVAVVVTVYIARQSYKQTQAIAVEQERRELQGFHSERKSEFRAHVRQVLSAAHAIGGMLNPRMSDLLSVNEQQGIDKTQLRRLLAQLETEVSLLTVFAYSSEVIPAELKPLIAKLFEEAAWVYSDALHLAILEVEPEETRQVVDVRNSRKVVDLLLNGSAVNLAPRLLPGYVPEDVSGSWPAAHVAWQEAYDRREKLLLASRIVSGQPLPDTLAGIAARSLQWVTLRRFEDLVIEILATWDTGDAVEFRFNV